MNALADAVRAYLAQSTKDNGDIWTLQERRDDMRRALAAHDIIADAAAEAAILADTAPAHAREFWRRLAGSLRKAATVPR